MQTEKYGSKKPTPAASYRAFVVRCWLEGDDQRFELVEVGRSKRPVGSADLPNLLEKLQQLLVDNR